MFRVPALIFSLSGIPGLRELLVHPLVEQVRRHFVVELVVEPGGQPPRLGPERRVLRQERRLGRASPRGIRRSPLESASTRSSIFSTGTCPAGFIRRKSIRRSHGLLLHQLDLDLLLRQHQADLATERRQRLVIETAHVSSGLGLLDAPSSAFPPGISTEDARRPLPPAAPCRASRQSLHPPRTSEGIDSTERASRPSRSHSTRALRRPLADGADVSRPRARPRHAAVIFVRELAPLRPAGAHASPARTRSSRS